MSSAPRRRWRYRLQVPRLRSLCLSQRDADGLTNAQPLRAFRARLDQEHELGALLHAVDHRRGELRRAGDETDLGDQTGIAAVTADGDGFADAELGQDRLGDEEPYLQIGGWQGRKHRLSGTHQLAHGRQTLVDAAGDGAEPLAPRQPDLARV